MWPGRGAGCGAVSGSCCSEAQFPALSCGAHRVMSGSGGVSVKKPGRSGTRTDAGQRRPGLPGAGVCGCAAQEAAGRPVGWLGEAAGSRVGRAGDSPCWAWGSGDERPGICMGAGPGLGAGGVAPSPSWSHLWRPGRFCSFSFIGPSPSFSFPALCRVPWATENRGELPSSSLGLERDVWAQTS